MSKKATQGAKRGNIFQVAFYNIKKFILSIKIFSASDERLDTPLNNQLSLLIPVIYGAVFSYTMYVFSKVGVDLFESLAHRKNTSNGDMVKPAQICFRILITYIFITIYMIGDVGSVMKINGKYAYRRTSRYTQEFFIALFYIFTFSLLYVGRIWAIIPFCIVVLLGGLWFNNLKEENEESNSSLISYARSQRRWHYIGAVVILLELILRYMLPRIDVEKEYFVTLAFTKFYVVIFVATLAAWTGVSKRRLIRKHGDVGAELSVDPMIRDYIIQKHIKKHKDKQLKND